MNNERKRIGWISAECFVETDIYVVPMLARYYEVDWFIIYKDKVPFDKEIQKLKETEDLTIHTCQNANRLRSPKTFSFMFGLVNQVAGLHPDIVYSSESTPQILLPLLSKIGRGKVVLAAHNVKTPKGGSAYWYNRLKMGFMLNAFRNFHTLSMDQHDLLLKLHPGKNVLYTPFVLKNYGEPTNMLNQEITFLNFGNIRQYKRIDLLIQAAEQAYDETGIRFKVVLAGSCSNWEEYQRLIKHPELFNLTIRRIDDDEIPNLFGQSHYFVMPYQDIAQSGSMMVAVNYGKPVICSDMPSFKEVIEDGKTGFFFPQKNLQALKNVLVKVLKEHDTIYPQLCANVRELHKQFDAETIVKRYRDYFNDIIAQQA